MPIPCSSLYRWLYCLFCLCILPWQVWSKEKITWMKYAWPPVYIDQGPYQDQGNADAILMFFQESLPEFDHETAKVNPARAIESMKTGDSVCMVGTLKTPEREQFLYFAIPIGITLPNAIIIKKSNLAKFGNQESLSLVTVLQNKEWKGGIVKERSYTPEIDAILQKYKDTANLTLLSNSNMTESLMQMLLFSRVQYIIEYPWVAEFLAQSQGEKDMITSIAIQESDAYSLGRMACSKTPKGRQIIDRVNDLLLKARSTPQYREFVERWNDQESLKRIRKAYDEIFLKTITE